MRPAKSPPTLVLDWRAPEPVYVQIARRIRDLIASGDLEPGAPLPPVRALASDLGVNLNTVARAYRALEEEGFLRIRKRCGAEVRPPAPAPAAGTEERLRAGLRDLLLRTRQAGLPSGTLRRVVHSEIENVSAPDGRPGGGRREP
ncbi:MAG: GntR family transcriptional regulator [Acidobacteriota bacterium]